VKNVKDFGAAGDGLRDDTAAIQAALDAGGEVYFPAGNYVVTRTLNVTNRGDRPTILFGAGISLYGGGGTTIIARTGDWIADFTGSQFVTVRDLRFHATGPKRSTKGLLFARSASIPWAVFVQLSRILVWIESSPGASRVGSIALANNAAENFICDHSWFIADTPVTLTMDNELGLVPAYTPIGHVTSATGMSFRQVVFKAITGNALSLWGIANATFDDCYWDREGSANGQTYAIALHRSGKAYDTPQDLRIGGQVENFPAPLFIAADATNVRVELTIPNGRAPHVGLAPSVTVSNLVMNVHQLGGKPQPLFSAGSNVQLRGGDLTLYRGATLDAPTVRLLGTTVRAIEADGATVRVAPGSSYVYSDGTSSLRGAAAHSAVAVADGAVVSLAIPVEGAALGAHVKVFPPGDLKQLVVSGCVSAPGAIEVTLLNRTGGPVSLAPGLWRVVVEKF
jgi:hypothetical protein